MITYKFLILILLFLLLLIFFLSLNYLVRGSGISGYRVIKTPADMIEEEIINYTKLKHKYDAKQCKDRCKSEVCDDYLKQKIKYDLCKECKKEFKCFDPYKGECKFCLDFRSCETLYGCNNKGPNNPMNNECNKCWE